MILNHFTTLVELLRWRALHQPNQRAYTFLLDGGREEALLTYGELDWQARAIAAQLQDLGARGERALLFYPSGLAFISAFFGCLYAGVVAVPTYPPKRKRRDSRLLMLQKDAQANVVLTTPSILAQFEQQQAKMPELAALHWLDTTRFAPDAAQMWQPATRSTIKGDSLAFLQYTSGSTGTPKGVMVTHRNLLHNQQMIKEAFGHSKKSVVVGWLPLFHDMGLIGNVLQPLYLGIPCHLMSPTAFIQQPIRWLRAISRLSMSQKDKTITSGGPNFAYELCVRKISPHQRNQLDLSRWQVAFNGAEPVRAETLQRFCAAFAAAGFRREAFHPCYGMAEATLMITAAQYDAVPIIHHLEEKALLENRVRVQDHGRAMVGCGQARFGQKIVIVDPQSKTRCAADQIGEIWVSGSSVAQGYWKQAARTKETFHAYLHETQEGPFLRTGDLGYLSHGELFITGRLKDLIIIRGRNHYPQDIEQSVEPSHPALRSGCSAAFSVEHEREERLVVCVEIKRTARRKIAEQIDEVINAIRQAVLEAHEIAPYAIVLLKTATIPKTSSGKIKRQRCRMMFLEDRLQVIGAWYAPHLASPEPTGDHQAPLLSGDRANAAVIQDWMIRSLSRALKIPAASIDPSRSFAELGLDSVMMVELAQQLQASLPASRQIDATVAWNFPSIDALARHLAADPPPNERENGENGKTKPKESTDALLSAHIETLSDDEMAALLLTELTLSQQARCLHPRLKE